MGLQALLMAIWALKKSARFVGRTCNCEETRGFSNHRDFKCGCHIQENLIWTLCCVCETLTRKPWIETDIQTTFYYIRPKHIELSLFMFIIDLCSLTKVISEMVSFKSPGSTYHVRPRLEHVGRHQVDGWHQERWVGHYWQEENSQGTGTIVNLQSAL